MQRALGLFLTILSSRIVLPICNSISSSTTGHSSSQNSEAENKRQEQIQGGYASIFRHFMFAEQNCSDIVAVIRLQCHGCQHPSLLFGKSFIQNRGIVIHGEMLQVNQLQSDGIRDKSVMLIMIYFASAWTLGCCFFGCLVLQRSIECRIGRQYLCQASLVICGVSIIALTSVQVIFNRPLRKKQVITQVSNRGVDCFDGPIMSWSCDAT